MTSKVLSEEVLERMETSVLCWLATVSKDGMPNVSPKEAFMHDGHGKILIAHIASPQSVGNLESNGFACLSFLDVFVQKGFKIQGKACVLRDGHEGFQIQYAKLRRYIGPKFPIHAVIEFEPETVSPIIAPSYRMFPEIGERDMVRESLKTYRVGSALDTFQ